MTCSSHYVIQPCHGARLVVWGLGYRVKDLRSRVKGLGFRGYGYSPAVALGSSFTSCKLAKYGCSSASSTA